MAHQVSLRPARLHQQLQIVSDVYSLPHWKYHVTALLGLFGCNEIRTLSVILWQVVFRRTLSGMGSLLQRVPWSVEALTVRRQKHFNVLMASEVVKVHDEQRA